MCLYKHSFHSSNFIVVDDILEEGNKTQKLMIMRPTQIMGNTTHMVVYLTDHFCVRVSPRRIQAVEWFHDCFVKVRRTW